MTSNIAQFPSQVEVGISAKSAKTLLAATAIVVLIAIIIAFSAGWRMADYTNNHRGQTVADKLKAGWTYPDPNVPRPPTPSASQIHYPTTPPTPGPNAFGR